MRRSPLPKILVHRPELGEPPDLLGEVWAVVTDAAGVPGFDAPHFPPDQVSVLAEYIEQRLLGGSPPKPAWNLPALLAEAGRQHGHLCPGQVLGVRMAILGCERRDRLRHQACAVELQLRGNGTFEHPHLQTVTGCT